MTTPSDHDLLADLLHANRDLLMRNQQLITENNELLERQEQRYKRILVLKIVWYSFLIGIPLIAYYFLYNTFLGSFGSGVGGSSMTADNIKQIIDIYTGQGQ